MQFSGFPGTKEEILLPVLTGKGKELNIVFFSSLVLFLPVSILCWKGHHGCILCEFITAWAAGDGRELRVANFHEKSLIACSLETGKK